MYTTLPHAPRKIRTEMDHRRKFISVSLVVVICRDTLLVMVIVGGCIGKEDASNASTTSVVVTSLMDEDILSDKEDKDRLQRRQRGEDTTKRRYW